MVPSAQAWYQRIKANADIDRRVKAELEKQLLAKATAERDEKIGALEKRARDWRDKANVHRGNLAPEIRELYLSKAADGEDQAERLRSGGAADNLDARNHAAAAEEYRHRARAAETAEARRYLYDKAREFDARTALARGPSRGHRW